MNRYKYSIRASVLGKECGWVEELPWLPDWGLG